MVLLVTPFEGPKTVPRHRRHRRRSIGFSNTPTFFESSFFLCCVSPCHCKLGTFFFVFFCSRKIESLFDLRKKGLFVFFSPQKKKESHNTRRRHTRITELFSQITKKNKKSPYRKTPKNTERIEKKKKKKKKKKEEEDARRGTESDLRS